MEPPPSSFEMNPVITAFPPTPPAASLSNLALHEGGVEKNEERSSPPARGGTHQTDPNEEESGPDDEVGDEELGLELATNSTSGEILGSADNQGQELGRSSLSFLSADEHEEALAKVVLTPDSVYQVIAQAILNENTSNLKRSYFLFLGFSLAFLQCFSCDALRAAFEIALF